MELIELQSSSFTKWVTTEQTDVQKVYTANIKYKDDVLARAILRWSEHPDKLETNRLKVMVRQGIRPKVRTTLWQTVSGGSEKLNNNPSFYQDTVADIGIQIPSMLSSSMFSGTQDMPSFYYLSPAGERTLLKLLYVLTQIHPDIQHCPILPPLATLFLHFMEEDECYACLSSILDSRRSLLDQSQRAVAVMAKTFQDCLKAFMKPAYKQIKGFIQASITVTKGTILLPYWLIWLFRYLDFWSLVYIVDSFLLQGPKVLVRVGLVIFNQFNKWLTPRQVTKGSLEVLFSQFMKECPLKGYKLQEAAFRIRGLSRKRLTKMKNRNIELLEAGILEIPFKAAVSVRETTLMAIEGTDMLSALQWEELCSWLPDRLCIKKPVCVFSTENDGCSIHTFYSKCQAEAESVLLVKTSKGEVIGAFCAASWSERTNGKRNLKFFGTGESLVFSLSPHVKRYIWYGLHGDEVESKDFFMAGDDNSLIIGGGGDNALWLDADLNNGYSGRSETFNNDPLTTERDFICTRVEVLGFHD